MKAVIFLAFIALGPASPALSFKDSGSTECTLTKVGSMVKMKPECDLAVQGNAISDILGSQAQIRQDLDSLSERARVLEDHGHLGDNPTTFPTAIPTSLPTKAPTTPTSAPTVGPFAWSSSYSYTGCQSHCSGDRDGNSFPCQNAYDGNLNTQASCRTGGQHTYGLTLNFPQKRIKGVRLYVPNNGGQHTGFSQPNIKANGKTAGSSCVAYGRFGRNCGGCCRQTKWGGYREGPLASGIGSFSQSRASRAGAWITRFHCIKQQARCAT
jgi:hypothetical protein